MAVAYAFRKVIQLCYSEVELHGVLALQKNGSREAPFSPPSVWPPT